MHRMINASTALILSFLVGGCGGHNTNSPIPNTPEVSPTQNHSPEPLAQPSSLPLTKAQIRQAKSIFSANTTCADGVIADWCATLNVGESYSFGLVLGGFIPDDPNCPGGSEIELSSPSTDKLVGISVAVVPHQYPIDASVQPKNFTVTALPSSAGNPNSISVVGIFTHGFYDALNKQCLGFDEMATGYTEAHVILTGIVPSPSSKPTVPCPPPATPGPVPYAPIPVTDRQGKAIYGGDGQPVLRPNDGHDPVFFENQGTLAGLISKATNLVNFNVGGSWDEQRIAGDPNRNYGGNGVNANYVDYATVAIGLYGCASNTSEQQLLAIQEAVFLSRWPKTVIGNVTQSITTLIKTGQWTTPAMNTDVKKAPGYMNLPLVNYNNTQIGYQLCQNHTFPYCSTH